MTMGGQNMPQVMSKIFMLQIKVGRFKFFLTKKLCPCTINILDAIQIYVKIFCLVLKHNNLSLKLSTCTQFDNF
jgi:hypothetical protein